jgi:ligand-binding SRPBCC domain-containing protein
VERVAKEELVEQVLLEEQEAREVLQDHVEIAQEVSEAQEVLAEMVVTVVTEQMVLVRHYQKMEEPQ